MGRGRAGAAGEGNDNEKGVPVKAVVLHGAGDLRLEEQPAPACPEDGVVIAVSACGVCAADMKMAQQGHRALVLPRVLGHEVVGRILDCRAGGWRPGQRVAVAPGLGCGGCRWCSSGMAHRCADVGILGFTVDGGYRGMMALPVDGACAASLLPVPDAVTDTVAALTEPLACCINAQLRLDIGGGDTVLIAGGGPMGLLHSLLARERGAWKILVSDPSPLRRQLAARFPVDGVVDPSDPAWCDQLRHLTGGSGIDVLILAAAQAAPAGGLADTLNRGARISLFSGMARDAARGGIDWNRIHYNEWSLTGAYGCATRHCELALRFLDAHAAAVAPLITRRCTLADLPEILLAARPDAELKTIVEEN